MKTSETEYGDVYIVRHAEAYKTLANVHGGSGTELTEQGITDCNRIALYLIAQHKVANKPFYVIGSNVPQVRQTGVLVAASLGTKYHVDDDLRGMDMGVLSGLSDDDAHKLYPEEMHRLEAWRQNKISVDEIHTTGAECMDLFIGRVSRAIMRVLVGNQSTLCVVVTRSVGIACINLLLGYNKHSGQQYKRFRLDPGSITRIRFETLDNARIIYMNNTKSLARLVEYRDD